MMLSILERVEVALSLPVAAEAAGQFLDLHRPPAYESYNPGALCRRQLAGGRHILNVEPVADAVGDTRQVVNLLRLLIDSAELEPGAVLLVDVFQQPDKIEREGVPCVALAFDGVGWFPKTFSFGEALTLDMDELQGRWTAATRGGRIDSAPNGLLLRLKGQRAVPEPTTAYEPVREALPQGAQAALAIIEGDAVPELADLKALVLDVVRECRPVFEPRGVVCETLFASDLPPVPVLRARIRGLFRRLIAYAVDADSPGAAVAILFEYAARRDVLFVATISGVGEMPAHAAYMASFRSTIDAHHGSFEAAAEMSELTLSFSLPDPVGRALDEEIPGFDSFSEQSKKVLRLLKSGGQTPPPELLLQGVLEEELARWLLPQLQEPPAVNVAHELDPKQALASPERLKKALDQIRKGKIKRDIATLPFACEIIYAYRETPRARAAIGADKLSESDLGKLAKTLAYPAGAGSIADCIRILASRH